MSSIDQRIVEMRFDNKEFNQGVQTTMTALEKLKTSLNFQGVGEAAKSTLVALDKVDLSAITSGIGALQDRFSTFGIVGMQIIQNLTNTVMQFGKNLWNNTFGIIKTKGLSRATNIQNAKFMLQGLIEDQEEVNKILDQASQSVNDTAYGYDEAAKAAGQFAASGIGSGDLLNHALRGITGVAATTNSAYEDISRIFTTVSGNGRLMGDQLNQLASRGLNAASTLAKELGKTEEEVRKMTSKGEISFEMFATAMDSAFGEHAKKANETFNGAMSNMKAALGRIGADWYTPFLEQNSTTVKTIVSLKEALVDVKNAITTPLANGFLPHIAGEGGLIDQARNKIEAFKAAIEPVTKELSYITKLIGNNVGKTLRQFSNILSLIKGEIKDSFGSIDKLFGKVTENSKPFIDTANKILDLTNRMFKAVTNLYIDLFNQKGNDGWLYEIVNIFDAFKNVIDLVKEGFVEFFEIMVDPNTVAFKGVLQGILDILGRTATFINRVVIDLRKMNFIPKMLNVVLDIVEVLYDHITALFDSFGSYLPNVIELGIAVSKIFETILNKAQEFASLIKGKSLGELPKSMQAIVKIFGAIKTAIDLVKSAALAFVRVFGQPILNLISTVMDPLLDIIIKVADAFTEWGHNFMKEDGFTNLFETILGAMRSIIDFGKKVVGTLSAIFSGLYNFLRPIFTNIGGFLSGLKESFKEKFHSNYFEGLGKAAEDLKEKFHPLQAVFNGIKKIFEVLGNVLERLKPVFGQIGKAVGGFLGKLGSTIIDGLKGKGWDTFMALLNGTLLTGTVASLQNVMSNISNVFKQLNVQDLMKKTGLMDIKNGLVKNLNSFKDTLVAYQTQLKGETLLKIGQAISFIAGSLWLLSGIPAEDLAVATTAIATLMGELAAVMSVMEKLGKADKISDDLGFLGTLKSLGNSLKDFMKYKALSQVLIAVAGSVLILSVAVTMLASLPTEQMQAGLFALGIIMLSLMAFMGVLSMLEGKLKEFKSSIFIAIAAGILIIAIALKMLSKISPEEMNTALTGLVAMFAVFSFLIILAEAIQMLDTKYGQGQLPDTIKRIGKALEQIAIAILVVAVALKIMSTIHPEQMMTALVGLVVSLSMMALVIAALAQMADKSEFEVKFGKIAGALLVVANSLMIVAIALKLLSSIGLEQMCVALIGMGGALAAIGLFFYAMSNYADPKDLLKTSAAITIMSAALIMLSIPLKIFSKMSLEEICKALLMLVGTLLSVTVVAVLMSTWAPTILYFASSLLVLGVAMLAISTAIFLFSAAIASLAVSGPLGVAALGALLVEIVAFVPLMLAGFLAAINQLLPQIFMVIQNIIQYVVGLVIEILFVEVPKILDGIGQLLSQICDFLILHIPELFAVLGVLTDELAAYLIEHLIPKAVAVVGTLISEILSYVSQHAEEWIYDICVILADVFNGLSRGLAVLVPAIGNFIIDLLNTCADWLYENSGNVADALLNIIESVFYAALTLLTKLWEKVTNFLYDAILKPILEFFGIASPSKKMAEIGENIVQGLVNGILGMFGIVKDAIDGLIGLFKGLIEKAGEAGEAIYDAIHGKNTGEYEGEMKVKDDDARKRAQTAFETGDVSQLEGNDKANYYYLQLKNQGDFYNELYPTGYKNGEALIDGTTDALADGASKIGEEGEKSVLSYADTMKSHLKDAKAAGQDISDASIDGTKSNDKKFGEAGEKHAWSYADTMKSKVSEAKKAGTLLASGASIAVNSKSSSFTTAGNTSGKNYGKGIESAKSSVVNSADNVTQSTLGRIKETKEDFKGVGKYLMLGFKEGLEDKEYIQAIRNAAGNVSYIAADEMRKAGVIKSPSRVTMQIGRYFVEGLALGLEDTKPVQEAAESTAKTVLGTISGALEEVGELADGLNVSPTISPVLDMNSVDTGMLSSMLNANKTMTMSGNLQVNDSRSQLALLNALNNLEKNGNRDVVTALNVLSGNVAQYTDAVRNMRIVMDSGTLVGEIGEAMDSKLGSIVNYRQRGMM